MTTYFLSHRDDGRIVLDRECHGALLQTVRVNDPPVDRRVVGGDLVDVPQYAISYSDARQWVSERGLMHVRGEGWFYSQ
jgi:hypothetical protein